MPANSAASKFPTELKEIKYEIEAHAQKFGLDFFPVIFEVLDYAALNEVASYGGFPHRYPHWRFGMEYDRLSKSHAYGLSKIYEMVINNSPCYAYLLKCNNVVDQKLVMGHVYGHCDFFKNNLYFAHTNRKMVDEMANHSIRLQRYVDRYGADRVEAFIDCCLSLENLIDPHWPFIRRRDKEAPETVGTPRGLQASMIALLPPARAGVASRGRRTVRESKTGHGVSSPTKTMSPYRRSDSRAKDIWMLMSTRPSFSRPGAGKSGRNGGRRKDSQRTPRPIFSYSWWNTHPSKTGRETCYPSFGRRPTISCPKRRPRS
jgi:hypothetical protein